MPDKIILEYENQNIKEKVIFERSGLLLDLSVVPDDVYKEVINDAKKKNNFIKNFIDDSLVEIDYKAFKKRYKNKLSDIILIDKYTHKNFEYRIQNQCGNYEIIILLTNDIHIEDIDDFIGVKGFIDDRYVENEYILVQIYPGNLKKIKKKFDRENVSYEENFQTIKYVYPRNIANINSYIEDKELPLSPAYEFINYDTDRQSMLRNEDIIIGLMDNGVQGKHPDLAEIFDEVKSYNFFKNQTDQTPNNREKHGTHCAGILAGFAKNKKGVVGTGAGSTLVSYKIAKGEGDNYNDSQISIFYIIQAFHKALADQCDVINCSWSLPYKSTFLHKVIIKTIKEGREGKGLPVVFAAGNAGKEISFPAIIPEVIVVSASDLNKRPFDKEYSDDGWSSNFGDNILVGAPGIKLYTTDLVDGLGETPIIINEDEYPNHSLFKGTSAAAPIIAGFIAKILINHPDLELDDIKNIITNSVIPYESNTYDDRNFGSGIINYNKLKIKINNL
ncbi:S8 family serine peptidase [uncultured Dokdonia sp.]|uniref:S8 family peptidase n=1 Tax=uncultured Dokdonia sp. TaxID=575653 RepID=UPI0026394415|nr:S8 family serine peptidase [uncultured Dokdonia sp.]